MSNSVLLFVFLSFFYISATSSPSSFVNTTHLCSIQQSHALILFKQNLSSNFKFGVLDFPCTDWLGSGYIPIMMNWNTSTDCCDWNGVTCDHSTGDVIGLDLSCGMLQGTIHPNTTLFHLPRLQRFNLAYNDFTGSQLPVDISRVFNSLTHLNISFCGFTGQVPTDISHLHKLVSLDLSGNLGMYLEPHVFINLLQNSTVMKELSLKEVSISSVLPTNLNISSSSLKLLNLGFTGLQGNLPHSIFNLQSLENLDLSGNSFTGHIPSEILLLPNLVSLDLSWNRRIDNIQPHIFKNLLVNSTFLMDLSLGGVHIGFGLPTYLNISSPLRSLSLRSTSLQGKLPDNILNHKHLETLDLQKNPNLSGPLPKVNTSTHIPLMLLDMAYCHLSGSLPKSLGNLRYLEFLDLSFNKLSGTLPSSLFTLPSLNVISLDDNRFQGNMPPELFSLHSLTELYLANNQLTGQIDVLDNGPSLQTFQRLTNLTILDISHNNFRGDWELGVLLSSLTNLNTLDLSHSGISVTTVNAIHYVNPGFQAISLASCSLKVFLASFRAMTNLFHLDLSNNDIQGHIPDWVGEIRGGNGLTVLDLSNNLITGTIPDVYGGWGGLEYFILNGNQLEGKVPNSLWKCQYLSIIDLGNNQLSDTFPGWLDDLPRLKVLVLRSNNFHGAIVTSSTSKFPFQSLRILDLSHNGFVGQLPTKYFQNFNAMKNGVVKYSTEPEYFLNSGAEFLYYYTITFDVKGVDRYFQRLLVAYTIINLSNNKFDGEIPNIIGNLKSLKVLNLSHNSLTGRIPHSLGKISEIESLDLSWNQLTGEIPQSLTDLTFLAVLNLSQNHLVGHIPQGKQFDTFCDSFGGNPKLYGPQLSKKCGEYLQTPQPEGDGDGDVEEEDGFTWKVVVMGFGCGVLLGIGLGYLMLSTGRPKWFIEIADAVEHTILKRPNKRR